MERTDCKPSFVDIPTSLLAFEIADRDPYVLSKLSSVSQNVRNAAHNAEIEMVHQRLSECKCASFNDIPEDIKDIEKLYLIAVDRLLKQEKIDVKAKNKEGRTLLYLAIKEGKTKIAKLLIEALIKEGADLNTQANDGNTPLHWALIREKTEVAQLLIEALIKEGADLNTQANDGTTPLHWALLIKNTEVAKLLFPASVRATAKNALKLFVKLTFQSG